MTPRATPSTATSTPATATFTPRSNGEGEPAARGRRGRPTGSGRGPRAASAEQGDGTSRRRCPKPGCSEPPSSEGSQGGRVTNTGASCTYCSDILDYSAGDLGDGQGPVLVTCSHGGFAHARCMWDRAERLANSHVDLQPCVTCCSEWPVRSRHPHPTELAQGLPRSQPGGRWPSVGSTLQFAELLQEGVPRLDPASYVTTGSHDTFELMVRAHGRSPTSSFPLCSLFSDALDLRSQACLDFPRSSEREAAFSRYRTLSTAFEVRPQDVLLRLRNRRLYIKPRVQEYVVGIDSE